MTQRQNIREDGNASFVCETDATYRFLPEWLDDSCTLSGWGWTHSKLTSQRLGQVSSLNCTCRCSRTLRTYVNIMGSRAVGSEGCGLDRPLITKTLISQSEGYSEALVLLCPKKPDFSGDKAAGCSGEVPD